jgi:phytoene desaturase
MRGETDPAGGGMDTRYDAIVVGCGLGGISAAALLAMAGRKVLAVERQDGVGGCARAFTRGPYTFDPAIHILEEAKDGRFVDLVLRYLGVRDRCNLFRVDGLYRAVFPDFVLDVPSGFDEILEAHVRAFPEEEEGLRKWFGLHRRFFAEAVHMAMQISLRDLDAMVERFPVFFKHRSAVVAAALDECLTDPRVKGLCSSIWPYMGLPPSRLSFYTFSQLTSVLIDGGSYYCEGSFQKLADAFAYAVEENGGDLVVGQEVERILVENGRVAGVRLGDGREVEAQVVISNADATQTFERLVGAEHTPAPLAGRLKRMEPSLSAFVIYAATDLDLGGAAHETFLHKHWDHDRAYEDILSGHPGGMWANVPTAEDPSLAPDGEHLVILTSLAPYDIGGSWEDERERFADEMLHDFDEQVFPGLRDHLTFCETATPLTLERFTLNHRGAIYGWAATPRQTGSKRLSHDTPIDGLYLSGHWTHEGPASFRVILSGIQTARMVLERAGLGGTVPTFRPADLPPLG